LLLSVLNIFIGFTVNYFELVNI